MGTLLGETGRAWRCRLDQRLKPLGLSQAKWITLLKLSKAEDGMTQTELAMRVGVEGPTLARLLDRMSADGWIERRESDADRRSKTVHLRRKSCALLEQINAVAMQLSAELLEGVPPDELRSCMDVLLRIKEKAIGLETPSAVSAVLADCKGVRSARDTVGKRVRTKAK
ncbi:MAG: MarR family transcriptional regulator [Gallionella sp.]|nr:MarR family transcriptional regulator [Gallionella sp.]